jgi:hypothetical protein
MKSKQNSTLPTHTDDEDDFRFRGNEEVACILGLSASADLIALGCSVLTGVRLSLLEDDFASLP